MTAKDMLALVFKTHQSKPNTSPPPAFLVVQVNQGDGPSTKLTDETVLSSLYTNTHTLDYEVMQIAKNAPSPAKIPSPAKKPKPVAPAKNPSPAKKPKTTSPAKKANGKKQLGYTKVLLQGT